ncbi:MAG: MarR family transcriptional regulator [Acidiphilium sp.]|jgi:DNA-binding MarR family transcriptional regulator|nr:MarR family transcriptional regulator [Acidiphilium sp.]
MATQMTSDDLVGIFRDTIVALVRRDGVDLSARQLGVFLTCYLNEGAHTVRGLAGQLNVSKPAITRALDRLSDLDLARRKVDPADRRSVLVQRTTKGSAFLREIRNVMGEMIASGRNSTETAPRRPAAAG